MSFIFKCLTKEPAMIEEAYNTMQGTAEAANPLQYSSGQASHEAEGGADDIRGAEHHDTGRGHLQGVLQQDQVMLPAAVQSQRSLPTHRGHHQGYDERDTNSD